MREGPGAAEYELITVGRGLRHAACAGHAAGAADVFDDHLLSEDLRQPRRQHASDRIGRPAGGVGNVQGRALIVHSQLRSRIDCDQK